MQWFLDIDFSVGGKFDGTDLLRGETVVNYLWNCDLVCDVLGIG